MPRITQVGRVLIPVSDQDAAIAFYVNTLGFSLVADVPFAESERWVEVAPPGGGAALRAGAAPGRLPARTNGEIVNTCGWDRGDLPSILLSDHLPRVIF